MRDRRRFLKNTLLPASALYFSSVLPVSAKAPKPAARPPKEPSALSKKLRTLTRTTHWTLIEQIKVQFKTFHCQGMVKIGNEFWVSSVDTAGKKGHLFKIDNKGSQLADIAIGEDAIFHPSGIDFDGKHIYIAAAEYRPDSQAIIYRFDPFNQKLEELFRWQDHIGGVLRNPDTNTLHGISWGSRRFYQWPLGKNGKAKLAPGTRNAGTPEAGTDRDQAKLNSSFYIDYQDNQYIGGQEIVYTGLSAYKNPAGTRIAVGGIEIVDLEKQAPVHQVPVDLWSPVTGAIITQNPSFFELVDDKLRAHFMPDDNESTIFIYETTGQ